MTVAGLKAPNLSLELVNLLLKISRIALVEFVSQFSCQKSDRHKENRQLIITDANFMNGDTSP